jgi:hypothetical protein
MFIVVVLLLLLRSMQAKGHAYFLFGWITQAMNSDLLQFNEPNSFANNANIGYGL